MAYSGAQYTPAEGGDDAGSQFSGAPAELSGFAGQPSAFSGFPVYGAPYGTYGAYGAAPLTHFGYPGAEAAFPAGFPAGFPAAAAAGPVYDYGVAPTAFHAVPTAIPVPVRRPGYNERYVAWKNRQKAFNRYKQATKQAIKNARNLPTQHYAYAPATTVVQQPLAYPGATFLGAPAAAPQYLPQGYEQFAGYAPFGAYGASYGLPLAYPAATSFGGDFNSYSETSQAQAQNDVPVAQDEPEIRGTQV